MDHALRRRQWLRLTRSFGSGVAAAFSQSLRKFKGGNDGAVLFAGVVFDKAGRLHGTTSNGGGGPCNGFFGTNCGTIFKLIPNSMGGWTYQVPRRFQGKPASEPEGAVVLDAAGNLYLTTSSYDGSGLGTVGAFEITP